MSAVIDFPLLFRHPLPPDAISRKNIFRMRASAALAYVFDGDATMQIAEL